MNKSNNMKQQNKPKIMVTFREGGENGGPYVSHMRIMNSCLKEKYDFIPLYVPRFRELLKFRTLISIVKKVKSEKPNIYHFAGLQLEGFYLLLIAKLAGIKRTVCAVHGSTQDAMNISVKRKALLKHLERYTLSHSAITYGVSEFVSNWEILKDYAKWNFGHVYNMPSTGEERNKKCDNIRAKLGIDPDAVVVVSTGRITKDKGFDVLKDVICNKTSWDNVVFLIVGDGEYLPIMKKEMAEKGLGDTVIFTGYRSDVLDILRASDIFIICSYHETFCISVVEASGEGLPVIATNIGGIPEIVDNGVSGMLVAAGDTKGFIDSLIELIDNPTRRKKMGSKGRDIVQQHFSETIIADKLGDMYERLLQIKK